MENASGCNRTVPSASRARTGLEVWRSSRMDQVNGERVAWGRCSSKRRTSFRQLLQHLVGGVFLLR